MLPGRKWFIGKLVEAKWNSKLGSYVTPRGWRSVDGSVWTDSSGLRLINSDEFQGSAIRLIGGCEDGGVVF